MYSTHVSHDTTMSATDVAYQVGFKNRSHFSFAFEQCYGYAPSAV